MTEQAPALILTKPGKSLLQKPLPSQIFLQHNAALVQHAYVKQAAFQGGHIWGQILCPDTMIPSPDSLGVGCAWTIPTGIQDMLWLQKGCS